MELSPLHQAQVKVQPCLLLLPTMPLHLVQEQEQGPGLEQEQEAQVHSLSSILQACPKPLQPQEARAPGPSRSPLSPRLPRLAPSGLPLRQTAKGDGKGRRICAPCRFRCRHRT